MKIFLKVYLVLLFLVGCSDPADQFDNDEVPQDNPLVGFFEPSGVNSDFASKVDIQLFNLSSVDHLRHNLAIAQQHGLAVLLDIGSITSPAMHFDTVRREYLYEGEMYFKRLEPKPNPKLRRTLDREQLKEVMKPYLEVMQDYHETVSTVFLADEPYLNGITYQQLDTMAVDVRSLLDLYGLDNVKIGTIFASAMFNSDFAAHIDRASSDYVREIDRYHAILTDKLEAGIISTAEKQWLDIINDVRLTTYDLASNMYTGGGIPSSIDVVGFNFYMSTLMKDRVHDQSLAWFAQRELHPSCDQYKNRRMVDIREKLSFWGADPSGSSASELPLDKYILDGWYTCRTTSAYLLLKQELAASLRPDREVVLTSESSTNGLLNFDKQGNYLQHQNKSLTDARVRDEVERALHFIKQHPVDYLLFFTYGNAFDYSINLSIGGVSSSKAALDIIYNYISGSSSDNPSH